MKNKKINILVLTLFLISLVFLTGCEKKTDLPSVPPPPGRQGLFYGQAISGTSIYPDWAAQPKKMFVFPEELEYEDVLKVKVIDYDYIYRFGYYFNTKDNIWEMFELEDGELEEDWYLGKSAMADIEVTDYAFEMGENYIVVYACDKEGDYFNCNDNQWMLTYFNVEPEEPYYFWVIEDDINDFIFLSSDRTIQKYENTKISVYSAEYLYDNNPAIVEVAEVPNFNIAKNLLSPWTYFKNNYGLYEDSYISTYQAGADYYMMWISEDTIVKIEFEGDEFPTDLVEEYLEMWPATEIDFDSETLPSESGDESQATCGNGRINSGERCDPPETECIIEEFPIIDISNGDEEIVDQNTITIMDIMGDVAIIDVNGMTQILGENQIKEFRDKYIHVFEVKSNKVRLAFGYELGDCTDDCRCQRNEQEILSTCGNGIINSGEVCDPPGSTCTAPSGLASRCGNSCKCPEPLTWFTFCGDNVIQKPNSMMMMEQCDPPGQAIVNGVLGTCTRACVFIPTGMNIPFGCGNNKTEASEECDPPGAGCVKDGSIGKCSNTCSCEIIADEQIDLLSENQLKKLLCGREDPECYGIGKDCIKNGENGKCSANCECVIGDSDSDQGDIVTTSICGNYEVEEGEECDPPGRITQDEDEQVVICSSECKWIPYNSIESVCGDQIVDLDEECDPPGQIIETAKYGMARCTDECKLEPIEPECHNGILEEGEECDYLGDKNVYFDQQRGYYISCDEQCKINTNAQCGNNIIETGEQCDTTDILVIHPITKETMECVNCKFQELTNPISDYPRCGDGVINQDWEECDSLAGCTYYLGTNIPLSGTCDSISCICNPLYSCQCFSGVTGNYLTTAMTEYNKCKIGSCSDEVTLDWYYNTSVLTIDEGQLLQKYYFEGDVPTQRCVCYKSSTPTGAITGATIIETQKEPATKRDIVIIIAACLMIVGIMAVNLIRKN